MKINTGMSLVIVNADDFGLNEGVNQGIIRAHQQGIVTSTSLMVRQTATLNAVSLAKENPTLSVGLHLDFGEWVLRESQWDSTYQVVEISDPQAVEEECHRQILRFHSLLGRMPSHIDSHQHVHNKPTLRNISIGLRQKYEVPVRHIDNAPVYCGAFYGQGKDGATHREWVTPEALCSILSNIDAQAVEICCHPSTMTTEGTMYSEERVLELQALCHPKVQKFLQSANLRLINFEEYRRLSNPETYSRNT